MYKAVYEHLFEKTRTHKYFLADNKAEADAMALHNTAYHEMLILVVKES